jgi:dGTPase
MGVMEQAEGVVDRLFRRYLEHAPALPAEWRLPDADDERRTRRIADFLAGMTDRYALAEYERLFGGKADLG